MFTNEDISNIVAKQFSHEATAEELLYLQHWLEADAQHRLEYEELVKIWEQSKVTLSADSFDTNTAWLKIDKAIKYIQTSSIQETRVIRFSSYKKWLVAASIIGAISLGWFIWTINQQEWKNVAAVNKNEMLQLPDGSTVLLRKGSTLAWPAAFNKQLRTVKLNGEAFFQVQHKEDQPFLAITERSEVKVLGTSFLLHSNASIDEVVVVTGRVSVTDKDKSVNHVVITAGQKVVLKDDQFTQSNLTDSNYIAWKTGLLDFKNTPLVKVLEDATHYYGTSLELAPGQPNTTVSLPVTVRFENQPLDEVVDELCLIAGLKAKKENGKVVFSQK